MPLKAFQLLLSCTVFVQYGAVKPCLQDEVLMGWIRPAAVSPGTESQRADVQPGLEWTALGEDPANLQSLSHRVCAASSAWEQGDLQATLDVSFVSPIPPALNLDLCCLSRPPLRPTAASPDPGLSRSLPLLI